MKIEYGFQDVHVARRIVAEDGTVTFEPFRSFPNAKSTDFGAQGDSTDVFADNKKITVLMSNQGYSGNMVFTSIPDWFFEEYLNNVVAASGALIEDADKQPVEFAMAFRIENDAKARLYLFPKCVATRPNIASSTKENSITPADKTLTITAMPDSETVEGKVWTRAFTTPDTDATVYNNWFKTVQIPTFPEQVSAPVASVKGGTYAESQSVTLTSATAGATIYYTVNGFEPTVEDEEYDEPITISANTILKAIAVKSGMADSNTTIEKYIITA